MALDPNGIFGQGVVDNPTEFSTYAPNGLPSGVEATADYYAQYTIYNDGRRVVQWYKRGTGDGKSDPVLTTTTDTAQKVKADYDAAAAREAKPDQVATINGVPSQVVGKDANGRDIWAPVQTANGPATATATAGATQKPPGGREGPEGTPDGQGGFDNTRPRWVVRDAQGKEVWARPLEAAERQQWEKDKNGGKTDAEMATPPDRVGKPTGNVRTNTANGTTKKETEYVLPDGTKEWRAQTEVGEPDRVGKPTGNIRTKNESGQTVKETEYVLPNGTKEWRAQTETSQSLPSDMPPFRPDPNKEGFGTIEYAQQLAALRSQNKVTDAQVAQWIGYSLQQATEEAKRLDLIKSAQQQQQTNEISQRNTDLNASVSRLNAANTATATALDTSQKLASNYTNDTYAKRGGSILDDVMTIQNMRANQWGGLDQPARIGAQGYPMLGQLNQMGMQPSGAPAPVIPAAANMMQPNQIGAGGTGSAVAPVTAGITATNVAANDPTGANVQAANQAVQAGSQAAFGAVGVPPQAPVAAPVAAPINPPAGQPGNDPNAPVGQAPQQQQMLPAALQMGVLAQAHADGKYPPDVLQEAARQLGWV